MEIVERAEIPVTMETILIYRIHLTTIDGNVREDTAEMMIIASSLDMTWRMVCVDQLSMNV